MKTKCGFSNTRHYDGWRTAEGVEMQRLRKGTTLTPMPWKLYSKDEYAESSHYAAHQEYAN
jgi:hypothetical protein